LTGWAQVNGGREISVSDKAAMDIWYVHNASFRLDLVIALRTLRMILLGERPNAAAVREAWQDLAARAEPKAHSAEVRGALAPMAPRRVA
jgi:hypothetical protein